MSGALVAVAGVVGALVLGAGSAVVAEALVRRTRPGVGV